MSNGLNKVMLIGNLGQDPEIRETQGGQSLLSLRVAVSERYKERDGEWQEKTEWVSGVIWGKRAESLSRLLRKGAKVYLEGGLQTRSWEDQEGNKRYSTEVNVREVILLDGRREGQEPSRDEPSDDSGDIPF